MCLLFVVLSITYWNKVKVLVAQSCPALCNPKDCSLPDSSVYGILQARILEWVAIPFPKGSSWLSDQTQVSCIAGRSLPFEPPEKPFSDENAIMLDISYNLSWRRQWHPTPVLLPGKSHGRRSLVGCSPWGRYKSDTTERLHFHFSPSRIGEGNGNPLQCSCLESPRDGRAWWAAVYGVAQSRHDWSDLAAAAFR